MTFQLDQTSSCDGGKHVDKGWQVYLFIYLFLQISNQEYCWKFWGIYCHRETFYDYFSSTHWYACWKFKLRVQDEVVTFDVQKVMEHTKRREICLRVGTKTYS